MSVTAGPPDLLRRLDRELAGAVAAGPAHLDALVAALLPYGRAGSVQALVATVRDDPALAARTLERSLSHPLGFDKFVLFAGAGYQLRLHVWWPGQLDPAGEPVQREDIHDHRFAFASAVVRGSLWVRTFAIHPVTPAPAVVPPQLMTRMREERAPDGEAYLFSPVDRVGVEPRTTALFTEGGGYSMREDELHQVTAEPAAGLTATLLVRVERARHHTTVLVPEQLERGASTRRARFDLGGLRVRLGQVVDALG